MSLHAGFMKRLFAAIIDFTMVIAVTWLLFLFPFQQIIGKSVDDNYKANIKTPYDNVTEKYQGNVSYFGNSTTGLYGDLTADYDSSTLLITLNNEKITRYQTNDKQAYDGALAIANALNTTINDPYSAETSESSRFYSQVYVVYTYLDYAYQVQSQFPQDENGVLYSAKKDAGEITSDELTALEKEYKANLLSVYLKDLEAIIKALKEYDRINDGIDVSKTTAYKTIINRYNANSSTSAEKVSEEFVDADGDLLSNDVTKYYNYDKRVTTPDTMPTGDQTITMSKQAYTAFYYGLANLEFREKLAYIEKYNLYVTWAMVYALSMFTLIFSLYTAIMCGNTLGRRAAKVRLVSKNEADKLNPVLALLHDVPFRFLYFLLIGLYSIPVALIALAVFFVADIIMIVVKPHKAIRDYLSGTHVIEAPSSY